MATYKNKLNQPITVDLSANMAYSVAAKGVFFIPDSLIPHAEIIALEKRGHITRIDKPKKEAEKPAEKKPVENKTTLPKISQARIPAKAKQDPLSQGEIASERGEKVDSEDGSPMPEGITEETKEEKDNVFGLFSEDEESSGEQESEKPKRKPRRKRR